MARGSLEIIQLDPIDPPRSGYGGGEGGDGEGGDGKPPRFLSSPVEKSHGKGPAKVIVLDQYRDSGVTPPVVSETPDAPWTKR